MQGTASAKALGCIVGTLRGQWRSERGAEREHEVRTQIV